jgi:hypothetical protein
MTGVKDLEVRVGLLERRNAQLKNGTLMALLAAALPWIFAATHQAETGTVTASQIRIVSGDTVYGTLGPVSGGIAFSNSMSQKVIALTADSTGGRVWILDGKGQRGVALGARTSSGGFVRVYGGGKGGVALTGTQKGGEVRVLGPNGRLFAAIWSDSVGGFVAAMNDTGRVVAQIGANTGAGGFVAINSPTRNRVAWLNSMDTGGGGVFVSSPDGYEVGSIWGEAEGGRFRLGAASAVPERRLIVESFVDKQSDGHLYIRNGTGERVAMVRSTSGGHGEIGVLNPAQEKIPFALMKADYLDKGIFYLTDKGGNFLFSKPDN